MRRVLLRFGVVIVSLFVLFMVIGIVVSSCTEAGEDEESEGTSKSTESVESTPMSGSDTQPAPTPDRQPVEAPEPTVVPTPTPTPLPVVTPEPTVVPTPTFEESLRDLTLCDRVRADKSMLWGQAPGVIYSDDPRVTGRIQIGDYVRFLMAPNAEGLLRVQVYPHDGRLVGQSEGKVWIDWGSLERFRLDLNMFSCED